MKVTRDVIYDLLPSYFAGEASSDTRALIDEFLSTDPEFARMAERFRLLYAEHPPTLKDDPGDTAALQRLRALVARRSDTFGGAIGFTLGALLALVMGAFSEPPSRGPFVIAIVFGAVGAGSWIAWYLTGRRLAKT